MNLELKLPPVVVGLIAGAAMAAAARWFPQLAFTLSWRVPLAITATLAGFALALAGVIAFRRSRTTVDPRAPERGSTLVEHGIYRISRNPMYVGMFAVLVGWAMFLSNWAAVAILPLFIFYMTRFQIVPEERALSARFGDTYADYVRRVRRWL